MIERKKKSSVKTGRLNLQRIKCEKSVLHMTRKTESNQTHAFHCHQQVPGKLALYVWTQQKDKCPYTWNHFFFVKANSPARERPCLHRSQRERLIYNSTEAKHPPEILCENVMPQGENLYVTAETSTSCVSKIMKRSKSFWGCDTKGSHELIHSTNMPKG